MVSGARDPYRPMHRKTACRTTLQWLWSRTCHWRDATPRPPHRQSPTRANHSEREFTMQTESSGRPATSLLLHTFCPVFSLGLPQHPWHTHVTAEWRRTTSHNAQKLIAYTRAAAGRNPQAKRLRGEWAFMEIGIWFVRFSLQKKLGLLTDLSRSHRYALLRNSV